MDRTGLFAVGVLVFTLLAGVGPALGLPPQVAAFAFALAVGGFAVDQLFWRGRLGVLLVGLAEERQAGWLERVACHEAGHLLVARRLDIPVEDYTLGALATFRKGIPGSGGVVFAPPPAQLSLERIEAYCAAYQAGVLAEQLVLGRAVGGADDFQKLALLLGALARRGEGAPTALKNRAERRARAILRAEADLHRRLSASMLAGENFEVCLQLIDGARPAVPGDE